MTGYMLTAWSSGMGWRDIQVDNAGDIGEAIELAERHTGCRVSHGRGGVLSGFHPGLVIDAETGELTELRDRRAKPEVSMGPPDAVRAVQAAMAALKARPSNTRSNDRT